MFKILENTFVIRYKSYLVWRSERRQVLAPVLLPPPLVVVVLPLPLWRRRRLLDHLVEDGDGRGEVNAAVGEEVRLHPLHLLVVEAVEKDNLNLFYLWEN